MRLHAATLNVAVQAAFHAEAIVYAAGHVVIGQALDRRAHADKLCQVIGQTRRFGRAAAVRTTGHLGAVIVRLGISQTSHTVLNEGIGHGIVGRLAVVCQAEARVRRYVDRAAIGRERARHANLCFGGRGQNLIHHVGDAHRGVGREAVVGVGQIEAVDKGRGEARRHIGHRQVAFRLQGVVGVNGDGDDVIGVHRLQVFHGHHASRAPAAPQTGHLLYNGLAVVVLVAQRDAHRRSHVVVVLGIAVGVAVHGCNALCNGVARRSGRSLHAFDGIIHGCAIRTLLGSSFLRHTRGNGSCPRSLTNRGGNVDTHHRLHAPHRHRATHGQVGIGR